jgi:hypothetical protein
MFKKFIRTVTTLFALVLVCAVSQAQDFSGFNALFVNNVVLLQVTSPTQYLPMAGVSISVFDTLGPYEIVLAVIAAALLVVVLLLVVYEFFIKNFLIRMRAKNSLR